MCTSGTLATTDRDGNSVILLGKTIDFYDASLWHGPITNTEGFSSVGCGLIPQIGVNSGMNEAGLGILLSYLDYRGPFAKEQYVEDEGPLSKWTGDDRALLNATVLAKCATVKEAVELLYELVPLSPDMPGGNHMLADADGNVAVFEHCGGQMNHHFYEGIAARGNNGLLTVLEHQQKLPEEIKTDREKRCAQMHGCVSKLCEGINAGSLHKEEAIQRLKNILSDHTDGGKAAGSVCIHGLELPGARANTSKPLSTVTALIFDITAKRMHFTTSPPCESNWYKMELLPSNLKVPF